MIIADIIAKDVFFGWTLNLVSVLEIKGKSKYYEYHTA